MKGLRVTCIRSERPFRKSNIVTWFYRYQIWEHELIPVQSSRNYLWLPGRIIYHLRHWKELKEYVRALSPNYDGVDFTADGVPISEEYFYGRDEIPQ